MTVATWILAIATVFLAAEGGTALVLWRSRWEARAEEARTAEARRENELHRQRFTALWQWLQNEPEGDRKTQAARWYSEWTGARAPLRGAIDDGPQPPGAHSGDAVEAYERYVDFLGAQYEPQQRLGQPGPPLEGGRP